MFPLVRRKVEFNGATALTTCGTKGLVRKRVDPTVFRLTVGPQNDAIGFHMHTLSIAH